MKNKAEILLFAVLFCLPMATFAQASEPVMADTLRSEGKIWVVVAVVLVIFLGISLYLFALDRRISRLEKQEKVFKK